MVATVLLTISCGDDESSEDSGIPIITDPNKPISDPVGTITANISENTKIEINNFNSTSGYIWWTGPDNFFISTYYASKVSICDLGVMSGLGNITNIPQEGYTVPQSSNKTVACETGHGYIVKFEGGSLSSPLLYVRLYISETIVSTFGGIMGAKVKYQYPFEPTTLKVSNDFLSFTKDQNTQSITITTEASGWTYSCDCSWVNITKNNNTLSVSVSKNEYLKRKGNIVIQANEKQKKIEVEQASLTTSAPYVIGSLYSENGVSGVVYKISDNGTHGMIVSLEETYAVWSTVYYDNTSCTDIANGMNNMNTIKKISNWESNYPAFKWCNDFNVNGISGWYLPAENELNDLYTNKSTVNTTLMNCGEVQLTNAHYWSSSEYANKHAWSQNFYNGIQYCYGNDSYKGMTYRVRAVRAF